ncbi:hypothetical protein PIB30_029865 [Stylosanthes scabra]|uniref:F-box domain-containing protein n=1 Tax=Stylosanthes scabra TaxID=79078 RepID=A0ABU6ZCA2_9FABA|nr:hypothetical protein [Stylosanthes scabra]
MSDIPPKKLIIPYLPDEMCLEIFKRCDAKTLRNVKATSRYWRETLSSYEFVSEVSTFWKSKGDRSHLLVWNPAIGSTKMIPDPPRHFCTKCAFLYTFAYFPNSVNYGIVHLYKRQQCQKTWTLTLYSSAEKKWVVNVSCPEYGRSLDPNYASLDGVIYWMKWRDNDRDMSPIFIVSFSMLTHKFGQIFILAEATTNYHGLLIHGGKLCVGAINYDHKRYNCTIWEIDSIGETPNWSKLFTYDGYGHPYLPAMFIDGDVIQVLEKYYQVDDLPHMKHTIIHMTRWSPFKKTQYNLKWMQFDNFVRMRSLSTYYDLLFQLGVNLVSMML